MNMYMQLIRCLVYVTDLYVMRETQTWTQPASTTNYLYQSVLPELTEMTFCGWFEGEEIEMSSSWLLSIAHSGN